MNPLRCPCDDCDTDCDTLVMRTVGLLGMQLRVSIARQNFCLHSVQSKIRFNSAELLAHVFSLSTSINTGVQSCLAETHVKESQAAVHIGQTSALLYATRRCQTWPTGPADQFGAHNTAAAELPARRIVIGHHTTFYFSSLPVRSIARMTPSLQTQDSHYQPCKFKERIQLGACCI
jgi:hypothetical protein